MNQARVFCFRWSIGLHPRAVKQTLRMRVLCGRSPEMARNEIGAQLLAYDLIHTLIKQAADHAGVKRRAVSASGSGQTLNALAPTVTMADQTDQPRIVKTLL